VQRQLRPEPRLRAQPGDRLLGLPEEARLVAGREVVQRDGGLDEPQRGLALARSARPPVVLPRLVGLEPLARVEAADALADHASASARAGDESLCSLFHDATRTHEPPDHEASLRRTSQNRCPPASRSTPAARATAPRRRGCDRGRTPAEATR